MLDETTSPAGEVQDQRHDEANKLVAKGDTLLWRHSRPADAAGTYAQALQLAPDLLAAHLGMAEANLALSHQAIARDAAAYVQRIAPGTTDGEIAQAIQLVLDRQLVPALDVLDQVTRSDPGRPYAHALRGYILRSLRRDYDGALAEAKAARLAGAPDVRGLFPRVDPVPPVTVAPPPTAANTPPPPTQTWQPPTPAQRTTVRLNFFASQYPIVTFGLIGLCTLIFIIQGITGGDLLNIQGNGITSQFWLDDNLVAQGQWWRLITPIFLHASIIHLATNMLSLFFIGQYVERLYGPFRYLIIYLLSGIAGNLLFYVLVGTGQVSAALGASGSIAGVFGTLLIFVAINRRRLGPAGSSILNQLLFWLFINVALNFYGGLNLAWQAHLGGILAGFVLGILLMPQRRR